jgi:hypothetical protein
VTSRPYDEIERRFRKLTNQFPNIRLAGEEESQHISREISVVMNATIEEIANELELDRKVHSVLNERLSKMPSRTYL